MKSINLYIDKFRLTNFGGIHRIIVPVDGEEYIVNIFDSYNITIQGGQLLSNIDIFYVSHHETYQKLSEFAPLLGKRLIYDKQYKKSANILAYNHIIDDRDYIKTDIYGCFDNEEDLSEYVFPEAKYYVKPEYGARSLNQFIVNSKYVSLSYFLMQLSMYNENTVENAERIKKLVESAKGQIKHIKGNERYENEHADVKQDYCVQKAVENIKIEYRVINVGYGEHLYFFERQRNKANDGIVDNEINYIKVGGHSGLSKMSETLKKAFKKNNFFYGSADIVVTEDDKWTIVETANQYGGADIRTHFKYEIANKVVQLLVKMAKDDIDHLN